MIKTTMLGRSYGGTVALDGISFELADGEVAGFLGPNGAGKTTTMRILAGVLDPSGGTAAVNGIDVRENRLACRRLIGYLPENNPLYDDMEVTAFLRWSALMRSMGEEEAAKAVTGAIEKCGLKSAAGKDIGELSKGFRQRVGLASAMLHNPPVLLLDEPTSGLDPNQAADVRALIRELHGEKTVLLSTHILPEAREMCDRLIIISKGRIVADGKTVELELAAKGATAFVLTLSSRHDPQSVIAELQKLPGALSCSCSAGESENRYDVEGRGEDMREAISGAAMRNGWTLLGLERKTAPLEELFRSLTQ
jgi:ABC-2 type transport system ATP-binding protein